MHLKNDPAPRELCNAARSFGPTDAEIPAPAVSVKANAHTETAGTAERQTAPSAAWL